jgi:antibiotic biosynthesis monooxygenase (ABM) superfamily enzyme
MPTIEAGTGVVTHINTFEVDPENQDALVRSLTETVAAARDMPGWISASIHRSYDGRRVINYVQFESHEAAQRVTRELLRLGLIQKNTAIGRVIPGQYQVVHTLTAD